MTRLTTWMAACAAMFIFATTTAFAQTRAEVGQPAPDFELQAVSDGKTYKLSDLRGKPVVVFWQSIRCPWNFMREDAGYERVLYPLSQEMKQQDVQFLAINSNKGESIEQLREYVQQHNTPYPILKDSGNQVADQYGATSTPHFFVIDSEGVLRYKGGYEKVPTNPTTTGDMDEQYLKPVLAALLAGEELPYTQTVEKGCTIDRE